MYLWPILAVLFAALEAFAVSRNVRRLEYVVKPAVMVCLLAWLYASTGLHGNPFWFGLGLVLSLAGDVLLMTAFDRLFMLGLLAFLLAHVSYITGFGEQITATSGWSLILLIFITLSISRLLRRVVGAMRAKGETRLIIPVMVYAAVVSVMLYAAMSTLYSPLWKDNATLFVSLGALLFWVSDLILAWNRFVNPIENGRMFNIAAYQLGQIGLIAGVIAQFR